MCSADGAGPGAIDGTGCAMAAGGCTTVVGGTAEGVDDWAPEAGCTSSFTAGWVEKVPVVGSRPLPKQSAMFNVWAVMYERCKYGVP